MTLPDLTGQTLYVMRAYWEQEPLVRAAKSTGAEVVAVDVEKDASGFQFADHIVVIDDLRDVLRCYQIAEDYDVDAVLSDQCDYSMFATSYIAERMGLPGSSVEVAQLTTNKKLMRRAIDDAVDQPDYRICTTVTSAKRAAKAIGYPLVCKPTDNRGAFGISRAESEDQLTKAFYDALANSHGREVIVESFVEGTPVTVDGYVIDDEFIPLMVGSKNTPLGNLDPDRELIYPARIPEGLRDQATKIAESTRRALDVTWGPTHTEFILTEDGEFSLLEFHNRGGGVHTTAKLIPALTGFDVNRQLINDAVRRSSGQEEETYKMERTGIIAPIRFEPGQIARIEGLEDLRNCPGVLTLQLFVAEGDTLESFDLVTKAHGAIVVAGDDEEAAQRELRRVQDELTIVYGD